MNWTRSDRIEQFYYIVFVLICFVLFCNRFISQLCISELISSRILSSHLLEETPNGWVGGLVFIIHLVITGIFSILLNPCHYNCQRLINILSNLSLDRKTPVVYWMLSLIKTFTGQGWFDTFSQPVVLLEHLLTSQKGVSNKWLDSILKEINSDIHNWLYQS